MKIVLIVIAVWVFCETFTVLQAQTKIDPIFTEFPVAGSIRALEVISEDYIWFAGTNGMYGWTTTGGQHWTIDSIENEGEKPEFRSIAVTNAAVFLLSIGSPAYLYRSQDKGKSWEIVYQEDHPDIFYDSMKFWDDQNGIAMGDPISGCLSVITTKDGGNSWNKLDCSGLPETFKGEAAFAASNTNIDLYQEHVWLASGGSKARIFHSADRGISWEVYDTPMIQGGTMTGIFTVDFYDDKRGIIFGGDWENQTLNTSNKATTNDGGVTWQLIGEGQKPGYRSCVQFVPNSDGNGIMAVGIPGISYSGDGGQNWQHFTQDYYYTVKIAPTGRVAWLAGKNKLLSMKW